MLRRSSCYWACGRREAVQVGGMPVCRTFDPWFAFIVVLGQVTSTTRSCLHNAATSPPRTLLVCLNLHATVVVVVIKIDNNAGREAYRMLSNGAYRHVWMCPNILISCSLITETYSQSPSQVKVRGRLIDEHLSKICLLIVCWSNMYLCVLAKLFSSFELNCETWTVKHKVTIGKCRWLV